MSEEHKSDCPNCKSSNTQRVFSSPSVLIRSAAYMMAKHQAPKARLENMEKVREERSQRKKSAKTEQDALDNAYHTNKKNS